jgi:outer membrane protein OmpA-like peptidoglycan-associated protein/tetratricopeptide (TPR) repeat protein
VIKSVSFFAILLLFSFNSWSQERPIKNLSPNQKHELGEKLNTSGSYFNSVHHMKKLVDEFPSNKKYIMGLADAYFFSRDYKNAIIWYKKHISLDGEKLVTLALFRYAECLKYTEKYSEAEKNFDIFSKSRYREARGENFKRIAGNEVLSCQWAQKQQAQEPNPHTVIHLDDKINSAYGDFAPCIWKDSALIYSSLQSDSVITIDPNEATPHVVKLYTSVEKNGEWQESTLLPGLNTIFENNANGTFSPDMKRFYFTRCITNKEDKIECKIYVSQVKDSKFSKPKKLPKRINRVGYTSTQPNISVVEDRGKNYEVMIYSSNRPGGRGGMDLWYTTIDKGNTYKTPSNLGREINTLGDEITPFYDSTSRNLFFSSNFHFGFGGYDVFQSTGAFNKWSNPENLGKPINTRVDDTYFSLKGTKQEGFLVSNRPEGFHLTSETCCDDIYKHHLNKGLTIIKLLAYNNPEDQIELKDVKLRFFEIPSSKFPIQQSLQTKQSKVSDSTKSSAIAITDSNKDLINTFIKSQNRPLPATPNTFILPGRYKELPDTENSFWVKQNKIYLAAAASGKDTSLMLIQVGADSIFQQRISSNTSLTSTSSQYLSDFDLGQIVFYFNNKTDSSSKELAKTNKDTQVEIESEKSNTIAMAFKELESQKTKNHNKDLETKEFSGELKVILNYDFDDTQFIEKHSGSLDSLAALLKKYPNLSIIIGAHTDSKGSDDYNLALSKRRYKSIIDYMNKKGISRKRMSGQGYGETEPVAPNENPDGSDNPENRWLNRRAEITILEK